MFWFNRIYYFRYDFIMPLLDKKKFMEQKLMLQLAPRAAYNSWHRHYYETSTYAKEFIDMNSWIRVSK